MLDSTTPWISAPLFREPNWTPPPPAAFPFFAAALALPVLLFGWETYVDLRQRRRLLDPQLPSSLVRQLTAIDQHAGCSDKLSLLASTRDKYAQCRAYERDRLAFDLARRSLRLIVSSAQLILGVLPFAWTLSGHVLAWLHLDAQSEVPRSVVFYGIILLRDGLEALPLALYSDFVVEQRHGFNMQSLGTFAKDAAKLAVLVVAVSLPLLACLVIIARWAGALLFVYMPFVWAGVGFLLAAGIPLLFSFFQSMEPLEDATLRSRIEQLAIAQRFPLGRILVLNNSTRSGHSTALISGLFRSKTIVLYDTLLKQLTHDEVVAVISHELGHWQRWHMQRKAAVFAVYDFVKLYCFARSMDNDALYASFGFKTLETNSPHALVVGFLLFSSAVWAPLERVWKFLRVALSRTHEFEADAHAVKCGFGTSLQSGLTKYYVENLRALNPDPLYSTYHYDHPTLSERLGALAAASKAKQA